MSATLGVSALYHGPTAALVVEEEIVAPDELGEHLSRFRIHESFPPPVLYRPSISHSKADYECNFLTFSSSFILPLRRVVDTVAAL